MDKRLLDILCCPVSKRPLRMATSRELAALNQVIEQGGLVTVADVTVTESLAEALVTTDGQLVYRIHDGIPVMLPEEGIGTQQLPSGSLG
ncbi:Trm112 family protein [Frateuria aurantia]